jgi:hypothetical protein
METKHFKYLQIQFLPSVSSHTRLTRRVAFVMPVYCWVILYYLLTKLHDGLSRQEGTSRKLLTNSCTQHLVVIVIAYIIITTLGRTPIFDVQTFLREYRFSSVANLIIEEICRELFPMYLSDLSEVCQPKFEMYTSRLRVITAVTTDPEKHLTRKLGPIIISEFFGTISRHKVTLQSQLNSKN